MKRLPGWIDIPPAWLGMAVGVTWLLSRVLPATGWAWLDLIGAVLIVAGLTLMGVAVAEFLRAHTTFIPRRAPAAFVRNGVYRFTRNPIYLGDALVLAGCALVWDVLPALLLVPLFAVIITRRFILGEEAGLVARFGDDYHAWAARVRRWL